MKKLRLLTGWMAVAACATPVVSTLTSCSNTKMSEIASQIKDSTISTFMDLSKKTHRNVWNEQEAFDYVRNQMQEYGFKDFAGRDYWSYVPEVVTMITKEIGYGPFDPDPRKKWPDYGNVWYDIPASSGMEDAPKVILQAHLDSQMTFASDEAKTKWLSDGINVTFDRDNDILSTDGTTSLGADGGMGIALLLSIAKHAKSFSHGGIRLLFTAGESEGTQHYAAGAQFLDNDQNNEGKEYSELSPEDPEQKYIDFGSLKPFGDNENEFAALISVSGLYNKTIYKSVGGIMERWFNDSTLLLNKEKTEQISQQLSNLIYTTMPCNDQDKQTHLFTITIDNLHGGKSSKDINAGYANALQMLMQTMNLGENTPIQIISASSQPGAYNIAKRATCTFVSTVTLEEVLARKNTVLEENKSKFKNENWDSVSFECAQIADSEITKGNYKYGLSITQSSAFIDMFNNQLIFGASEWFDEAKQNVKTSYNHGKLNLSVDQNGENKSALEFHAICRTNEEEKLLDWRGKTLTMFNNTFGLLYDDPDLVQNHTEHVYNPSWEGTENNKIIDLLSKGYQNFNLKPSITDNHGWVEIGCFPNAYEKISPNLYMTSLGIEINNSQELNETVYTDSLNTLNKALVYALTNIKEIA